MFRLHPYEYIYYNSLVGGLPGANGKYETDYWGAGYREAVYWFNKNFNNKNKKYVIFVFGDRFSAKYYFKNNMYLTNFPDVPNYIFAVNRWGLTSFLPGKIIYSVKREGVPLIVVKEVHKVN